MGWTKILKVNSDMTEPLNFTNYIYDISVFGADSYVMDPNNSSLWDNLAVNSCYLYGHTAIYQYVYDRLTEENIDNLFNVSSRLGRQLNNFHGNEAYAEGDVNAVLGGMTVDSYNNMIDKMRYGYQRYVNAKLSMESGVGAWISDVFGVELSTYETIADIINSTSAWNTVLQSGPLMVALTSSEYAMERITVSDIAIERLADAINYVGQNEKAIDVIANNEELITVLVNDPVSMEFIASQENAVMCVLENEKFTTKALASDVAMTAFGNSSIAVPLICGFYEDLPISSGALSTINGNVTNIKAQIGKILNGSDISEKLTDAHTAISTALTAINAVTANATMVDSMVEAIIKNETFIMQALSNDDIFPLALAGIARNSDAMSIIANNKTWMYKICASQECLSILYNNYATSEVVFGASPYLLEASKASPHYASISNTESINCSIQTARRIHYGKKCFVLSVSQNVRNLSGESTLVDTLSGILSKPANTTYGSDGSKWSICRFAESASIHPSYANGVGNYTYRSDMIILKIE